MNLSRLLEKVNAIGTSVAIYKRDLKAYTAELKDEFGFNDVDEAETRLDEIDEEIEKLKKREKRLYAQAEKLLKDVENATNRK